jgi:3-hydroxyisobutyrate dehydrogenase-like beta-hydroxyacid dehydrogenase
MTLRAIKPAEPMNRSVAFLCLGTMGYPMAGHLANSGCAMTVYNRTAARADEWVAEYGGRTAKTPAEAVAEAERIGTKLEVTALVDPFYAEVQEMGGNRSDTSSLITRLK